MIFFPALAVVLLVFAGVLLVVAVSKRSGPARATALLLGAGAFFAGGAWMFGIV